MLETEKKKKLSLWHLSWPLVIEMLLQFLMGTVDSLMVSSLGDHEMSSVGMSNQLIMSIMTLFFLVNAGAGVVVARKWGANDKASARKTTYMSLKLNLCAGVVLSLLLLVGAQPILRAMHTPSEVLPYASTYLSIVGSGMFVTVLHMTLSTVIRSTGNTRDPMFVSIGMNAIHLALNYVFIFGGFGIPEMGVLGVSISTVTSRSIALLFCLYILIQTFKPQLRLREWIGFDKPLLKEMMSIGLPSIFTSVSWGASQVVLLSIVSSLGATPLAAYTYVNLVQQLPFMIGQAFGTAVQIQVGQLYGGAQYESAYRSPYYGARTGMLLSFAAALLLLLTVKPLLGFFTSDPAVIETALPVFVLCVLWQPMRIWTFTLTGALTAVGEARFVAVISVLGMWFTTTGGAYMFAVLSGWGVMGIFAAYFLDESFRAVAAWIRWRQRRKLPITAGENASQRRFIRTFQFPKRGY